MRVIPRWLMVLLLALGFIAGGCNNSSGSSSSGSPSTGGGPGAPVLLAGAGDQLARVYFTPAPAPPVATDFTLYWKAGSGGVTVWDNPTAVMPGFSPYLHMGLTNGTTYYYAMAASDAQGSSGLSNEVSATPMVGAGGLNSVDIAGVGTITFDLNAEHYFLAGAPLGIADEWQIRLWSSTGWMVAMGWDTDANPDPSASCVAAGVNTYLASILNLNDLSQYYSAGVVGGSWTLCVNQYATSQAGRTAGTFAGTPVDPNTGNTLTLTNGVFDALRTY